MQRQIMYRADRYQQRGANKGRVLLGIVGGVLYLVMALAVMQVAFYVWAGMWR